MINHNVPQVEENKQEKLKRQYATARTNLLLMLVLTVVNIFLIFVEADYMLLFSATVPYFSVLVGVSDLTGMLLAPSIVIALVALTLYLLCWIFSKKHIGWMIAALVLFIIDTVVMAVLYFLAEDFSGIFDALIHIWVLFYLIMGVNSGSLLSKMSEVITCDERIPNEDEVPTQEIRNSIYLRVADLDVKARILLESDVLGHKVCYRRVKRTNELVIDGYVYDEVQMLLEPAHILTAVIDGHTIQAGFDGATKSFVLLDGQEVAQKLRIF